MLEKSVLIPDYLINSTSGPFVALAVSILITAALLWILDPLEMFPTSSRIRKYGIAVLFFVLALSASVTFAGDRYSLESTTDPIAKCKAVYPNYQCQIYGTVCPANRDGGECYQTWKGVTKDWMGMPLDYPGSYHYKYCSDAFPSWNGSTCVADDPCETNRGRPVDDGSLDFGDGSNQKLSMSFPRREDDNYVGQTFCSGGCKAAVDKEVGGAGRYFDGKYYGQFTAKFSGHSCATSSPQATPKTTPALIPKTSAEYDCVSKGMGYGYVNDTVKCVTPSETKAVEKKSSETTKADGSKTKETRSDNTVCANGVCTTTTTTITTEYNSSGTETGTTTKTESTSKPDPNSGLGTGGAGTGKDGMACGGPGQPVCAVKVDETGTPTDMSPITAQKQAMESVMDEYKAKLAEVTGPKTWGLTWSYSLPTGTCTALQFGAGRFTTSLDVCKPLGYVRELWSYVIYFLTGLYIWRSARDALGVI